MVKRSILDMHSTDARATDTSSEMTPRTSSSDTPTISHQTVLPKWMDALSIYKAVTPEDLTDAFVRALATRSLQSLRFADHRSVERVFAWFSAEDLATMVPRAKMLEFICEHSTGINSEMLNLIDYTAFGAKLRELPLSESHKLLNCLDMVAVRRAFMDLVALIIVAAVLESPDIVYGLSTDRVHNFISDNQSAICALRMPKAMVQKVFMGILQRNRDPDLFKEFLAEFLRMSSDQNIYNMVSRMGEKPRMEFFRVVKQHLSVDNLIDEYIR